MISTELFPYESFGVRIEIPKENRIAWFKDDYDLQKYLIRSKLDTKAVKIDYRDGEPVVRSKKHKRDVEQKPEPKNNRSSGSIRKRKSSVDSSRNTAGTTKRKK